MVKFKPTKNIRLTKYDGKLFTPDDVVELTVKEEKEIQAKLDEKYPEHGKAFERVED